ncbi:MAG: corrinoid protein [Candidatus Omnitrophica bacterium]|nr:corrinoid protein [Candidatus Omnitrophota bacterium]
MEEKVLQNIRDAIMNGDRAAVVALTKAALEEGISLKDVMDKALIAGMEIVGGKFKRNEIFIPEVLISAKAMQEGMALLEPHFTKHGIKPVGRVLIGTVKGDLHDIGKNIVSMMLKGACFEIEDLGIDVSPQRFIDAAKAKEVDVIAMSSLLTTSMGAMKDTINALKESGIRHKVKVLVGGAPVTQDFASAIGADGYAKDAAGAVDKARELLRK